MARRQQEPIEVWDSVFDPGVDDHVCLVKDRKSELPRYRVFLYLRGPRLPFVRSVRYKLHPSFKRPNLSVRRSLSNPNCMATIWVWGLFEVDVTVVEKNGRKYTISHMLRYDGDLGHPNIEVQDASY